MKVDPIKRSDLIFNLKCKGCEKSISVLSGWPDPNDAA